MTRRYTGGFLSATEQVTDANTANGIFSVQDAAALTTAGSFPTGRWTPQRSLRFRASVAAYLNRTFGTPTNNKVWTWSAWVKRGSLTLADANHLFLASPTDVGGNPSTYTRLVFETDGTLRLQSNASASEAFTSSALFRDPAAWYHIVLSMDAVNTTVRCFVNGKEITYASRTQPTNANTAINGSGNYHRMGLFRSAELRPFDGYMADVNFVDGQALDPSQFGTTDPQTGTWVPKRYSGTYGNNGFYLDFRDNTAATSTTLGADRSGNGNNWTPNNFTVSGTTSTILSYTSVGTTTWTPPANVSSVRYLVVAGGGAGGSAGPTMYDGGAGGGGAGGMLTGTMAVTPGTVYSIYVGAGASGAANRNRGASGDNSVFSSSSTSITAIGGGGGGGGAYGAGLNTSGANGGSGGGGANGGAAGLGTAGQGNNGGYYSGSPGNGGGGAGGIGGSATNNVGANGGLGLTSDISGSSVTYAGGGGGGGYQLGGGTGGSSVGGNGGANNSNGGGGSTAGSGGGGSGGTYNTSGTLTGGSGANGTIILSYSFPDSTYDSSVDVPGIAAVSSQTDFGGVTRGNYATYNPLVKFNSTPTFSEGNLNITSNAANYQVGVSTIGIPPNSGKWYWETTASGTMSSGTYSGIMNDAGIRSMTVNSDYVTLYGYGTSTYSTTAGGGDNYYYYRPNTSLAYSPGVAYNNGDTVCWAYDSDKGSMWIGKNGVWNGNNSGAVGNPIDGTNPLISGIPAETWYPASGVYQHPSLGTTAWFANFGQRPFKYAPPTGFKTLNTTNLPTPVIKRPSDHFDVKTYTGNGTSLQVGTTQKQSSAYPINKSLRFRKANSAYLGRTPSTTGNQKTWTWSGWVKQSSFGSNGTQWLLTSGNSGSIATNYTMLSFSVNGFAGNANQLQFFSTLSNSTVCALESSQKFGDSTEWCNVVIAVDTTQVSEINRVKLYVDGVRIISFATFTPPSLNADIPFINSSSFESRIGGIVTYGSFDGYMTEVNFIDGQALTPASFGAYDANNNWVPQRYAGTYGTQGYYLPFTGDSFAGAFNGTTQYLQTTLPATLTGAFTIETYFYRAGSGSNYVFTLGDSKTSTGLEYYIGSSGAQNNLYSNDAAVITSSSNLPVANAWNHVAVTRDSGLVVRLFVNGVQVGSTWATSAAFSSTLRIGAEFYNSAILGYLNGGLSNFRIVNGTALYTSNFTPPTAALTAVSGTAILTLQSSTIIDNSGNSLSITNNGTIVTSETLLANRSKDYSPNGNNWTNNNIGTLPGITYDLMFDSPTDVVDSSGNTVGNYAVLDANTQAGTNTAVSNAGSTSTPSSTSNDRGRPSTLAVSGAGKWYAEFTFASTNSDNNGGCGIMLGDSNVAPGESATTVSWRDFGTLRQNATNIGTIGSALSAGEIVMVAYDAALGRVWFGKQGTWFASGDPATNANPNATGITTTGRFATYHYNSAATIHANFGQRAFTYTPPTGFRSLNTKNLKDVGSFNLPDTFGNFVNSPDLIWTKSRTQATSLYVYDTIRGPRSRMVTNSNVVPALIDGVTSFNPYGFTVGTETGNNNAGDTYVGWSWNKGKIPGFDTVTYTGNGANGQDAMKPHNLGQVPAFYVTKNLSGNNNTNGFADWNVWHKSVDVSSYGGNKTMYLMNDLAAGSAGGYFINPTSTHFSPNQINYDNSTGHTYIAYLWAEVPGFSKMGSWAGNSSTDGPFIYTGFRPRWIMTKRYTSTGNWLIMDTARNQFNDTTATLNTLASAESPGAGGNWGFDILSNGFKIRGLNSEINSSGQSYIYVAFAESPFKYTNAR